MGPRALEQGWRQALVRAGPAEGRDKEAHQHHTQPRMVQDVLTAPVPSVGTGSQGHNPT